MTRVPDSNDCPNLVEEGTCKHWGLEFGKQTLSGTSDCGKSSKFHGQGSSWREHDPELEKRRAEAQVGRDGGSFSATGQILREELHAAG